MSLYIMVKYNNYIYKIIKGFLYFFKINNLLGILIEFYRDKVIGCWLFVQKGNEMIMVFLMCLQVFVVYIWLNIGVYVNKD